MQKISACLWFDDEGDRAAKFYTNLFKGKITERAKYLVDTPSNKPIGSTMTVSFEILGHTFLALNGGKFFKINPSLSISVQCDSEKQIDDYYSKLVRGGKALMPLGEYGFSKKYGWVQDLFGVSWQLNLPHKKMKQKLHLSLMFTQDNCGNAEEAMKHYIRVFKKGKIIEMHKYGKEQPSEKRGSVMHARFALLDQEFMAMESNGPHKFRFSEGFSLMIMCKDQKEMDHFYSELSADPAAEICGWLKDRYGVSWQLITSDMGKMMNNKKAMAEMMTQKRIDLKKIRDAAK